MMSKQPATYPLEKLFLRLRNDRDFSIGTSEYLALLEALSHGFGMESLDALRNLCHLLWAKSKTQSLKLHAFFDEIYINERQKPLGAPSKENNPIALDLSSLNLSEYRARSLADQFADSVIAEDRSNKQQELNFKMAMKKARVEIQKPILPEKSKTKFVMKVKYSVLDEREMAQAWRKLRVKERSGAKTELDLDETVRSVAKRGAFFQPELRASLGNVAKLHFLVDREGSMVPFHHFSRAILEGASTVGNLSEVQELFFHDLPKQLYRRDLLIEPVAFENFLQNLDSNRSLVVIISDAGAARGAFDAKRISETEAQIHQIQKRSRNCIWLNPMPQRRWNGNSAEKIAQLLPMFECTGLGLNKAVDALRGQLLKPNVSFA